MKKKKYLSVIIGIALIWGLFYLSSIIESKAFNIFMYISWGVIILVLYGYAVYLRIHALKKLTDDLKPEEFIKMFADLNGNTYTTERYIYEALAFILSENYAAALNSLNLVFAKKMNNVERIKVDAVNVLYWYFCGNTQMLENAIGKLKNDYMCLTASKKEKYSYILRFSELIKSLTFDVETPMSLASDYFNSIDKKTLIDAYIANLMIGEAKLKSGDTEQAKMLFENICKNCAGTVIDKKAAAYLTKM